MKTIARALVLASAALGCLSACTDTEMDEEAFLERIDGSTEPLYIDTGFLWNGTIPVCWETAGCDVEKGWVRNAILRTWEQESNVTFTGVSAWASSTASL